MSQQTLRRVQIILGLLLVGLFGGVAWNMSHGAMILGIAAGVISSAVMDELFARPEEPNS